MRGAAFSGRARVGGASASTPPANLRTQLTERCEEFWVLQQIWSRDERFGARDPRALARRIVDQQPAHWERFVSTGGKWADGLSAKELARLWLAGEGPVTVRAALRSVLADLNLVEAIAEAQISFDRFEGGARNHELLA
jgi:hypothetical protein